MYRGHRTHFWGCTRPAHIFKQEIISPFDFVFIAVGKHLNANMISFFIVMGNNSQINEIKWLRRREDQDFESCWHGKQPPTAMLRHLGRESITGLQTRDKYCCLLYRLLHQSDVTMDTKWEDMFISGEETAREKALQNEEKTLFTLFTLFTEGLT